METTLITPELHLLLSTFFLCVHYYCIALLAIFAAIVPSACIMYYFPRKQCISRTIGLILKFPTIKFTLPALWMYNSLSSVKNPHFLRFGANSLSSLIFNSLGTEGGDHCGGGHCCSSIPRPWDMEQGQSVGSPGLWTGGPLLCWFWGQRGAAQRQSVSYEVSGKWKPLDGV